MNGSSKKRKKHGWLIAAGIIIIFVLLGMLELRDSSAHLQVSEYDVSSQKLPASFDGFKIVQLSDLHGAQFGELGSDLAEKVRELGPDIIALTGDFVTDEGDLDAVRSLAEQLVKICPVYFVSGNHEFGSGLAQDVKKIMDDAGVKYLSN